MVPRAARHKAGQQREMTMPQSEPIDLLSEPPSCSTRTRISPSRPKSDSAFALAASEQKRRGQMDNAGDIETAEPAWRLLEGHFHDHAALMRRFEKTSAGEVVRLWQRGINEHGDPLSLFERDALIERHCDLFGKWPEDQGRLVQ